MTLATLYLSTCSSTQNKTENESPQWHSHRGGQGGQSAPVDSEKFAKNQEKRGRKSGKVGKNQQKEENLGRFFHFAPPDR